MRSQWNVAADGIELTRSLMRHRSKASALILLVPLISAILLAMVRGSVVGPIGVINPSFCHAP
jgi:hypothetical protein